MRITEFCPTVYYSRRDGDCMLKQEADMMLNRIVGIFPERLTTYGVERGLGTQGGRYGFENYAVERYVVDNPQYQWKKISGTEKESLSNPACGMEGAVGKDIFDGIDGKIMTPQLCEPFGLQEFYTVRDKNKLILHSDLSGEYFLLERCEEKPEENHPKWEEKEIKNLLKNIYGAYQVTEFLPTKFFPIEIENGHKKLSEEEASLMIGRIITISENLFVTCDNYWSPNPRRQNREENGYWLADAEIVNPDYRIKTVWADEIYGIRDGMLNGELARNEYVEIDVYPGFRSYGTNLPQMYLVDGEKIILYAMGQYFLLERTEDEKAAVYEKDLSVWQGNYMYTDSVEEIKEYQIRIWETNSGEYEADIEIVEGEEGTEIKVKAYVYGNKENISLVFKEAVTEGWIGLNDGDVLLRFRRDMERDEVYTYWGKLEYDVMNLDTSDKEAGKICFVKE